MELSALLVCGGRSRRMNGTINKVYMEILGKSVLEYSLMPFLKRRDIKEVIIVYHPDDFAFLERILAKMNNDKIKLVLAGEERQHSVYNGLIQSNEASSHLLIHDGARPLLSDQLLAALISQVEKEQAVIPVLPLVDTIKKLKNNTIVETIDRTDLVAAQTPQVFERGKIISAYQKAMKSALSFTDDASIFEYYGLSVKTILGEKQNIKITIAEDLALAEFYLRSRK